MKSKGKFPDLHTPIVMGILNITPDSFYDGGRYQAEQHYAIRTEKMIADGAAIIDIGGASSRPGAKEISAEDEWHRIHPVIKSMRSSHPDICISIDTCHASVAEKCLEAGADMINDISGGTFDPDMARVIGSHKVPYVMMHIQGRPGNMQTDPKYDDVVEDIAAFFESQINNFMKHGASQLILDPGFGFGKTLKHNYTLLNRLDRFTAFGYPILVGLSRKSMINKVLDINPEDAINGTTVLNTIALLKGAAILRVHDVREAVEAIKLVENLKQG